MGLFILSNIFVEAVIKFYLKNRYIDVLLVNYMRDCYFSEAQWV
jgi:hypothetical protein